MAQSTMNGYVKELRSPITTVDGNSPINDIDEADSDLLNAFRMIMDTY